MTRDKQLVSVQLEHVLEKRRLDQALNAKEFAVLAGISYSAARAWFKEPGFPTLRGVVFWQDFVQWRSAPWDTRSRGDRAQVPAQSEQPAASKNVVRFTGKAAQILAEAGCR